MGNAILGNIKEAEASSKTQDKIRYFVRFSIKQRIEHILLMFTFTALAVTGLAEKYFDAGWGNWLIQNMGGIEVTRFVHRGFGVVFVVLAIYHLASVLFNISLRRNPVSMLPNLKDIHDIMDSLRYTLGIRDKRPVFDRYDYRQKFEYWGIIFGGTIMTLTGFILMYPIWFTDFLPGQFIAAAREAHGNEAMLAVLTIVIWHLYDVIFKPSIFPADISIFTGKISRHRMIEEHSLEYYRTVKDSPGESNKPDIDNQEETHAPSTETIAGG